MYLPFAIIQIFMYVCIINQPLMSGKSSLNNLSSGPTESRDVVMASVTLAVIHNSNYIHQC